MKDLDKKESMLPRMLSRPWELIQNTNFVVGWKVKDLGEDERIPLINSPMGPGDEMIIPGGLEDSCNMFSSI